MAKPRKPKLQKAEHVVAYDVDNTLVTQDDTLEIGIEITNPYNGYIHTFRPHYRHIALLKAHSTRGKHVLVWSAAGALWAQAVVIALNLEDYVDSIETKPELLIDDLPVNEIFPSRIYLKE